MHLRLLCLFAFSMVAFMASAQGMYRINGKLTGAKDSVKIFLSKNTISDEEVVDSAYIIKGMFTFKGSVTDPMESLLYLDEESEDPREKRRFWLENSNIHISGSITNLSKTTIRGSNSNLGYEKYIREVERKAIINESYIDSLDSAISLKHKFISKSAPDGNSIREIDYLHSLRMQHFNTVDSIQKMLARKFIKNNPNMYISALHLYLLRQKFTYEEVKVLYEGLSEKIKLSLTGQLIKLFVENYKELKTGDPVPDFTLEDLDGKPVTLSSFRGKHVLIIFWGSWCGSSRNNNKGYNIIYSQYSPEKIVLLGIALDKKEDAIPAISQDGIQWKNVLLPDGVNSPLLFKFGVWSVPDNMLLDPEGKIIGRDLAVSFPVEEIIDGNSTNTITVEGQLNGLLKKLIK